MAFFIPYYHKEQALSRGRGGFLQLNEIACFFLVFPLQNKILNYFQYIIEIIGFIWYYKVNLAVPGRNGALNRKKTGLLFSLGVFSIRL
jgi:hypothetical protein